MDIDLVPSAFIFLYHVVTLHLLFTSSMIIAEQNANLLLLRFVASSVQILLLAIEGSRAINLFILKIVKNIKKMLPMNPKKHNS